MQREEGPIPGPRPDGTPLRILIVGADPQIREVLSLALGDYGIIHKAGSREEAILSCHIHTYDLCFLDQNMHGMDGFDMGRQIRLLRPETRIVVVTTDHLPDDMAGSSESVAHRLLHKPFGFAEVRSLTEEVLGLPGGDGRDRLHERRTEARVLLSRPVRMSFSYPDSSGRKIISEKVDIIDWSPKGFCVRMSQPVEVGQSVTVDWKPGVVRWQQYREQRRDFITGVQITRQQTSVPGPGP